MAYRNSIGVTLVTSRSPPLATKLELRDYEALHCNGTLGLLID